MNSGFSLVLPMVCVPGGSVVGRVTLGNYRSSHTAFLCHRPEGDTG